MTSDRWDYSQVEAQASFTSILLVDFSHITHNKRLTRKNSSHETFTVERQKESYPKNPQGFNNMNKATEVFNIPELLELILLSLPCDSVHQETTAIRTILRGQTSCQSWSNLLQHSTPIRQRLYLRTDLSTSESPVWQQKHSFPPSQPNPWIPFLLLNQRSWGSAYPFDSVFPESKLQPSPPKFWTFSFEMSRKQFALLPPSAGTWRHMLAASPPFTDFWSTRCIYELGSGRAPFVTHLDYDPSLPKSEQRYRVHRPEGVTLGDICDAVRELFEMDEGAKFVMVESLRVRKDTVIDLSEDRPTTKMYIPGSSAERAYGWQRGYWGD